MADVSVRDVNAPGYTIRFALVVCLLCATIVSVAAVGLKPRQDANALLYKEQNVLIVAGLAEPGASPSVADVNRAFETRIASRLVDRRTGEIVPASPADARRFDQSAALKDPGMSSVAPPNEAGLQRLPDQTLVYAISDAGGALEKVVLPVVGQGMWGTVYGFIALTPDTRTVLGLTFYEQKETPGLGAEISNPDWLALWEGRTPFDEAGEVALRVIKGTAGPAETDPLHVDGLSGATITSRAVSQLIRFWLDENGHGPLLRRLQEGAAL